MENYFVEFQFLQDAYVGDLEHFQYRKNKENVLYIFQFEFFIAFNMKHNETGNYLTE